MSDEILRRLDGLAEGFGGIRQEMTELRAGQARLEKHVDALSSRTETLTNRVDGLTGRVDRLAPRVDNMASNLERLASHVDGLASSLERIERGITETRAFTSDNFADIGQALATINARLDRLDPPPRNLQAVR